MTNAPTSELHPASTQYKFKILSLDGGGIRGAYTAALLDAVETILREAGKLNEDESIASYFDLIAGTSTGGIIAAALAMGKDAKSILGLYEKHGSKIFARQSRGIFRKAAQFVPDRVVKWFGQDTDGILRAKYASEPLEQAIHETLGDEKLRDAKSRLVVPSARLTVGRPIVFRTAHLPDQIRDKHLSAKDVIMATTAAPTYFAPHRIKNSVQPGQYVDGGVWANHPGLLAFTDAMRISNLDETVKNQCGIPSFDLKDIHLLSIGTGETPSLFELPAEKAGLKTWLPRLVDYILTTQSQGTHFVLRHLIQPGNYHRINFMHVDWKLDSVERLQMLIDLGHCEARNLFSRIPPTFFCEKALPFRQFCACHQGN